MTEIQKLLFAKQDIKYRDFQAPLFPNIDKGKMIGVRTPDLKKLAKELYGSELANNFIDGQRIGEVFRCVDFVVESEHGARSDAF